MLCSFGSIWIFRLVHLSWDQCHFIQGRLRSWLQGRQAGWFRRWIAVCEGGTVGAAVGFAVGTAECEGIRLYTGVRTRLVTKIVLVTRVWDEYCRLMLSKIDIILLKNCDILHLFLSKLIWLSSDAAKSRFLHPNIAKVVCLLQSW